MKDKSHIHDRKLPQSGPLSNQSWSTFLSHLTDTDSGSTVVQEENIRRCASPDWRIWHIRKFENCLIADCWVHLDEWAARSASVGGRADR
ncbi:hypothetical protein POX_a00665 [Penicillium oxalicum]|uniref:hypothetical protein n=1 Tax=Penicillium oxalicum TaxID=69781 RepID=UPI0020B83AE7|nr:hypothetical protein POX_a00665 [Penicillium oxalicum]KAI2794075.1 hypothetical protein POX_a00665 [Penicillium oxalicum]